MKEEFAVYSLVQGKKTESTNSDIVLTVNSHIFHRLRSVIRPELFREEYCCVFVNFLS